jgi:hypothetical protein
MMSRFAVTFALIGLVATQVCLAQAEPQKAIGHLEYVILDNASDLSTEAIAMVAEALQKSSQRGASSSKHLAPLTPYKVSLESRAGKLGGGASLYKLQVAFLIEADPTEEEMAKAWEAGRSQFEKALREMQAIGRESRMRQLEESLEELTAQQHELDAVSQRLREEIAARRTDSLSSEANIGQGLGEALSRQRELQLDEAGNRARREAVERRIDELRKKAEATSSADPILKELETLVDIRERARTGLRQANQVQAGAVTEAQLAEADAQLAQARVDLLKTRRDTEEQAGGGALRELNNELSQLMVQAAEIQGQQKELNSIIDALRDELRANIQAHAAAERLQQELETVRQRRSHIDARWFEKQREKAEMPQGEISLRPLEASSENAAPKE